MCSRHPFTHERGTRPDPWRHRGGGTDLTGTVEDSIRRMRRLWRDADRERDGEHAEACGCWIWEGVTDAKGKPLRRKGKTMTTAARAMWEGENGPVPEGMIVVADCGIRLCVRPSHHAAVTPTEATYRRGHARLNERLARKAYLAILSGMSERKVARIFDISPRTAGRIARGEYWALRERKVDAGRNAGSGETM